MALRGNLKDFSLPDVFQLVTFSRKTGVLRIVSKSGSEGSVWFRDGEVFFASSNWRTEPLGERLVRAQRLTRQALDRALSIRSKEIADGRRLGQILIDEGYLTDKVLEAFVQEQIQDTIFDLMRWDEGDFDFEAMPEVVEEDIGLTVSIENVVMEGSRRLEEWNRIRKKIPSMDVVFKMATAPGEGTFEISLKPMEWQLLLLIDSTRSVSELATETRRTDFEVARVLYGLFSAGLLEFASDAEIAKNRAEREQREARLAKIAAERRKVEDAEKTAALEREAALQASAEKRRGADEGAAVAERPAHESAAAETVAGPPSEVPTFLSGGPAAPTADDEHALEEFMGALLGQPGPVAEPEAARRAEPHVPVEEPAFIGAQSDSAGGAAAEVTIEDLLGMKPEPAAEAVPEPSVEHVVEPAVPEMAEQPATATAAAETVEQPATTAAEAEVGQGPGLPEPQAPATAEPEAPATAVDFEHDLMELGLGELPSDLLEPVEPASVPEELATEPELGWVAPEPVEVDVAESTAEPVVELFEEPVEGGIVEPVAESFDLGFETEGEVPEVIYVPPVEGLTESPEDEMDFSALIESLDVDAEDFTVLPSGGEEPSATETGFDEELLRDDTPVETGKVISTDAFLSDITMDDLGFSGGLTDELSALTGAERRPARPQASVNAIPEPSASVIKRDVRVDKDTVLKIIDGIKNL